MRQYRNNSPGYSSAQDPQIQGRQRMMYAGFFIGRKGEN